MTEEQLQTADETYNMSGREKNRREWSGMLSACITELVVVFLAPVEIRVKNYSERVYGFIVSRQLCLFESVLILLELGYFTKHYENWCAALFFYSIVIKYIFVVVRWVIFKCPAISNKYNNLTFVMKVRVHINNTQYLKGLRRFVFVSYI